jgi:hypothetical protein
MTIELADTVADPHSMVFSQMKNMEMAIYFIIFGKFVFDQVFQKKRWKEKL